MKDRSLLALPVLVFALSCGRDQPMAPRAPTGPSEVILDGANGPTGTTRNKDFFFLPPLVAPPFRHPDFELGEFNNALRESLRIEICVLDVITGLPTTLNVCVGDPIKTWGPGSPEFVKLVNLPRRQWGWWSLFGLPPDGFYYVLWNTRQQGLKADKYYRITVRLAGSDEPLGYADVDPMSSLRQWRHARTGEVIQLVNGMLLPIPFRVENGAFCVGGTECVSETVTNENPDGSGSYIVQVEDAEEGPLAGIKLIDGWLPAGAPPSVVFTITRVNTGVNNVAAGTQEFPCHARPFPLQQFDACFNYSTIPDLGGIQFTADKVIAAVCFVLHDRVPEDPREDWVQLWSSEPDEAEDTPKPLKSASATDILTNPEGENCETQDVPIPPSGANSSNPLTRFASTGWRKLTRGMGRVFGVKTAYAIDFGLGGILDDLSNIGPALTAEIRASSPTTPVTVGPGTPITSTVRIVGTQDHRRNIVDQLEPPAPLPDGKTQGIPGLPVTFTLWSSSGVQLSFAGAAFPDSIIVTTLSGGLAPLAWTPTVPGTFTIRADGQAKGGPVEFTATVAALPDLVVSSGAPTLTPLQISSAGGSVTLSGWTIANSGASFSLAGTLNNGFYLSNNAEITTADTQLAVNSNTAGVLEAGESFNWGGPTLTIPALAPGTYHIGILVDYTNVVAESNEGNNYVSAPLVVSAPAIGIDGVMSAGEWDNATVYGPFNVTLPGGGLASAKLYLNNSSNGLQGALQFNQSLSGQNYVIAVLRLDENGNGAWDNGEDGLVIQQRIAGSRSDGFFDEFFSCNVNPCQGQPDNLWGGTNNGVTASTDGATPTIIEFSKGINTSDVRDAVLAAGQSLRFFVFTNIGEFGSLVRSDFPADGWAAYTVR